MSRDGSSESGVLIRGKRYLPIHTQEEALRGHKEKAARRQPGRKPPGPPLAVCFPMLDILGGSLSK